MTQADKLRSLIEEKPYLTSAAAARQLGVDIKCVSRIARRAGVTLQDSRGGVDLPLPEIRIGE